MTGGWMVKQDGKLKGPFTFAELVSQAEVGKLKPDAFLRTGETEKWTRAERVRGIFPDTAQGKQASVADVKLPAQEQKTSGKAKQVVANGKPVAPQDQKKAGGGAKKSVFLPVLAIAAGLLLLIGGSVLAFSVAAQTLAAGEGGEDVEDVVTGNLTEPAGGEGYEDEFVLIPHDGSDLEGQTGEDGGTRSEPQDSGTGGSSGSGGSSGNSGGNGTDENDANRGEGDDTGSTDDNGDNGDENIEPNDPGNDNDGPGQNNEPYWRAEIHFETIPAGARLYINDSYRGVTPHAERLRMGSYNVTFRKEGYLEKSGRITITNNRMRILSVALEEEAQEPGDNSGNDDPSGGQNPPGEQPGDNNNEAELQPLTAIFQVDIEEPLESETITFSACSSTSPNGEIVRYHWHFGDQGATTASSESSTITYDYRDRGTYTVTLTVEDSAGQTGEFSGEITVRAPDPVPGTPRPRFTVQPQYPLTFKPATFNAGESWSFNGSISEYHWCWGDGTTYTTGESVTTKTYYEGGEYEVTLTITDRQGFTADKVMNVSVVTAAPEDGDDLGDGTIAWRGGQYEGDLENGVPNGEGYWVHPDGTAYQGEFRDGEFHGEGTINYPDGRTVHAIWNNGRMVHVISSS